MKKTFLISLFIFLFFPPNIFAQVVVNEFVPDGSLEWIELHNASASADYLKSYWVDDDNDFNVDSGNQNKKLLSDLNISSISYPYIELSNFLNNSGDKVVLFDNSGSIIDQYQYNSSPGDGVAIGRSPDTSGSFATLVSTTKGSINSSAVTPSPTNAPTNAPTSTPTPTASLKPTFSPSPVATKTPSPKPTLSPPIEDESSPAATADVLAARTELSATLKPSPTSEPSQKSASNFPFIAIGLIFVGLGLVGVGYNKFNAQKNS